MQIMTKRVSAIALAVCLLVVLAFGGMAAWAAGVWPPEDTSSLTVTATNEAEHKADIADANVVVDIIKIADATIDDHDQAYKYNLIGDFDNSEMDEYLKAAYVTDGNAKNWQNFANAAARLAKLTEEGDMAVTGVSEDEPITNTMTGLSNGLYLVIAHGKGIVTVDDYGNYVASSPNFDYAFLPTIVALPGKNDINPEGSETNPGEPSTDYGEWTNAVKIAMKTTRTPALGRLVIKKEVTDFSGEPATFVFHVTGIQPDGNQYENYASVYYPEYTETSLSDIPAGTLITVTEEHEGTRYELDHFEWVDDNSTIVSDRAVEANKELKVATVKFVNKPNGNDVPGHGIENKFEAQEDGNWTWHSTPVQNGDESAQTTK